MRRFPFVFCTVIALIISSVSQADELTAAAEYLKKGSITAGGQTALVNSGSKYSEDNSFSLSAQGGYFIMDELSIDGALSITGSTKWNFGQGIGVSKYFLVQEKWAPYVSIAYFNFQPAEGSSVNQYRASIGAVYFVLTHVAVTLSFATNHSDSRGSVERNSDGLYGGYSIYF